MIKDGTRKWGKKMETGIGVNRAKQNKKKKKQENGVKKGNWKNFGNIDIFIVIGHWKLDKYKNIFKTLKKFNELHLSPNFYEIELISYF